MLTLLLSVYIEQSNIIYWRKGNPCPIIKFAILAFKWIMPGETRLGRCSQVFVPLSHMVYALKLNSHLDWQITIILILTVTLHLLFWVSSHLYYLIIITLLLKHLASTIIGVCNKNLVTLDDFTEACKNAITVDGARVLNVEHLAHVPDYDDLYKNFIDGGISGMEDLHLLRVQGNAFDPVIGAENIMVHYKEDIRVGGYKPMPVYQGKLAYLHWDKYFLHPDPTAGNIEYVAQYAQDKVCTCNGCFPIK